MDQALSDIKGMRLGCAGARSSCDGRTPVYKVGLLAGIYP